MNLRVRQRIAANLQDRYYTYLIYLYALLLPVPHNIKSAALIVLTLAWLLMLPDCLQDMKALIKNRILQAFLFLYALFILSVFLSHDKGKALDFLVLELSIPLLPFLLYKRLTERQIRTTLLLFTVSLLAVSWLALYNTYEHFDFFDLTLDNLRNLDWAYFSYILPQSVDFHAPYFSLYISVGILALLHLSEKQIARRKYSILFLYILLIAYFFAFSALLSSRTALFSTVLVISAMIVIQLVVRKKFVTAAAILVLAVSSAFVAYKTVPYLQSKLSNFAGFSARAAMWRAAMDIVQENPVLGVGTGDRKAETIAMYRKHGYAEGVRSELNVHNQFLDFSISLGLLGLAAFAFVLFAIARYAVLHNSFFLTAFILIFFLCCLTESLLHRREGVVLFSFFSAIFVFATKDSTEEK